MRKAARRDGNEPAIIQAALEIGATVQPLSHRGVPDLLIGFNGRNFLAEVKDPSASRGATEARKLTKPQKDWHGWWRGQVVVIESVMDLYELLAWPCECGYPADEHPTGCGRYQPSIGQPVARSPG